MINETKALIERLRDIEEWARDCGWHNHASTACEAIAALSRPLPGVMEGMEPSEQRHLTINEQSILHSALRRSARIAPSSSNDATAYARGVEDAAKAALAEELTGNPPLGWPDEATNIVKATVRATKQSIADAIRALLHKPPATNAKPDSDPVLAEVANVITHPRNTEWHSAVAEPITAEPDDAA